MVNIPRKFTEDEVQSIVDKYLSGLSLEGVAKDLQCSPEGVRAILVRVGVPRRGFGRAAKPIGPTKVCSCCGIEKSRSEFTRNGTKDSQCKVCLQLKQLEKYHSDEEFKAKKKASSKASADARQGAVRAYKRHWSSGWTETAFKKAWDDQLGCCAICEIKMQPSGIGRDSVCADHDHSTGKTRSLLCSKCNKLLGIFEKNKDLFEPYLERWKNGV